MNPQVRKFHEDGFVLLTDLITVEECEHYKSLLEADYLKYSPKYANLSVPTTALANKSGEKVVYNLHNKDMSWHRLFEHTDVLGLLDIVLQEGSYRQEEPYYLNNISARCPLKGHPPQQLHIDSNLPGVNYCLIANVLWFLDDSTVDNGATRVVPGSHRFNSFAVDGESHPDEIQVTAARGSALIFNANLWHGGGENRTQYSRWAVALGYARWFIKPSFDFMQNTPKSIFDKMSVKQRELLGFCSIPPKDEFTRLRRRTEHPEVPGDYELPI